MDNSIPGFPGVEHELSMLKLMSHLGGDAIQPSHPLSTPSPPAFNLSQHQGLFHWVSSSHQVVKVLEFQLQNQSFQWIFKTLGLTGLISLQSKELSRVFSNTTIQKHNSSVLSFLYSPTLKSIHDYWKNHSCDWMDLCWQSNVCFLTCCLGWLSEKAMAPHSSTLAWKIHGQRSLVDCSPWGCEESDTTERLHFHFSLWCIGEGNPLQYSCLENPREGEAWWAAVYGVAQSRTRLKWLSSTSSSRLVIAFLPRSKRLFISWLQSPSALILKAPEIKSVTVSIVFPSICHEVMGPDAMILDFWMLSFKPTFSLSSFTFIKRLFSSSSLSAIRVVSSAYLRLLLIRPAIWFQLMPPSAQNFSWCTPHIS